MLEKVLAISGYGGLYKLVAQAQKNIVVECVETKKRMPIYNTTKINELSEIAMYTYDEEVKLTEVFANICKKEDGKQTVSHKASSKELKSLFDEVLPDYDKDRVYVSDIKKVVKWYNILQANDLISLENLEKINSSDESESIENTEE